jgi:hypothetical protein
MAKTNTTTAKTKTITRTKPLISIRREWNTFFFAKQSPVPIALFRIAYGISVIATLLLLRSDWQAWFGTHAWISLPTVQTLEPGPRLNLFTIIPQSDGWIDALFWVFLGSAILLTVGLLTRINSVIVFVCLASIHQRNLFITHGGDTFLRLAGFFLMFAPAGAALSFDQMIRIWRGKRDASSGPQRPWAQRMIQIQLSLLYFGAFCSKIKSPSWLNGSALYYVYHLESFRRFPVPSWFLNPTMLKLESWSAVAIEFSLAVLISVKQLRYIVLALGLLLHLWLEYSLNISLFQWDVLSAYILFVDPADASQVWSWIKRRVAGSPAVV